MKPFEIFNSKHQSSAAKEKSPKSNSMKNSKNPKKFIFFANDPDLSIKKIGKKDRGELSGEIIYTKALSSTSSD